MIRYDCVLMSVKAVELFFAPDNQAVSSCST